MPPRHRLLAASVAVIWGVNFLAIHASLAQFPPLFLVALRFTLIAVPTVLLVPRPDVPVRWLLGYGLGFGVVQFTFLYQGMAAGMPTGLASLVLQMSAPLTLALGWALLREQVRARQWSGIAIAVLGMVLVGVSRAQAAAFLPFLLVLVAALGWAGGNLASRLARPPNPLHLTLWMSVVVPAPMLALSLAVEGPARIASSWHGALSAAAVPAWLGLAYTCLVATVVGSGIWTWLLARHAAGTVAPFSMLVPVTGLLVAWLVLGEAPSGLELGGGAVVIAGVVIGAGTRAPRSAEPHQPRDDGVGDRRRVARRVGAVDGDVGERAAERGEVLGQLGR